MMFNPSLTEIAMTSVGRRRLLNRLHCLMLILALLVGGCAGTPSGATSDEYYRDAQLCRAQNPLKSKARSNLAGNLAGEIVIGVDTTHYLQCMARLGWQQDAKTDPVLSALKKCQRKAERPAKATSEPGGAKLSASLDRTAYRECLRQRGLEAEVTVDPLQATEPK